MADITVATRAVQSSHHSLLVTMSRATHRRMTMGNVTAAQAIAAALICCARDSMGYPTHIWFDNVEATGSVSLRKRWHCAGTHQLGL